MYLVAKKFRPMRIKLQDKLRWMRERQEPSSPVAPVTSISTERHYSVAEIAGMWNLSVDEVRKIFRDEPGVLVIGSQTAAHKRRYTTLRIPESVVQRVHRRLSNV